MSSYSKSLLAKRSQETGFARDSLEKVFRLVEILEHLNRSPLLHESLALKGGTAINLTIFDLPRLSVDIDMDYLKPVGRDSMLAERKIINHEIQKHMKTQGYVLSPKTKTAHSLDSQVFRYVNSGGNWDNIKLEINYSMRMHVLPPEIREIACDCLPSGYKVNSLAAIEIFGSKISALVDRAAARDLYDVNNMLLFGLFDETEHELLRKCAVLYSVLASSTLTAGFQVSRVDELTSRRIRTDLLPVIRRTERFSFESAKARVTRFLRDLMMLTPREREFVTRFADGDYRPELLFDNAAIVERIRDHPMALWRTRNRNGG